MKRLILTVISGLVMLGINAQTGKELPFQKWSLTPPMGWNSWDCYGPTVVESEVKANADYMASKLSAYGWEYVVVDIRWFVENDKAGGYNQTDPVYVYDQYGRYTPALNRFPSAAGGKGFKPLADYIHNLGLKFGIHIMRGLPKVAADKKLPVKGTDGISCDMIASNDSACTWLRDNYKVDYAKKGAQEYYNSIFELYAGWGVDFVKVDDLSRPYHTGEIEMIRKAIDKCGRSIVLSMSPGETPLNQYTHASTNANMWRTVDDFWDNWSQLNYQFTVCDKWAPYISPGAWPDADMLPLGKISIRGERGNERFTNFTKDEQVTLMSLWTIFKSPLMFGGNLPENNTFTDSLLTNREVLYMHHYSTNNRQLSREDNKIIWSADDPANGDKFAAIFNTGGGEFARTKNVLYRSGTISYLTTGYGKNLEVDIPAGSNQLCLIVTDAGDGYDSDHADWINPTLIMDDNSEVKLTGLTYLKGSCGWGSIHKNTNINGGTLSINGQTYNDGYAVHANSAMLFNIPAGVKKFKAFVGIDNTGSDQGSKSSVEFMVFNEDPTSRSGIDPLKAVANSRLICRSYQKEGINLTANITNAKKLYLVATDAGDGIDYDHADWINPTLVDKNGNETPLTNLTWDGTPVNGWGTVKINKNNDGGPLVVNGITYNNGYGVNANSIITFTLPEGHEYTTFTALVGYDGDAENASKGVTMEFLVFTEDPTPSKYENITLDLRTLGYAEGQECEIRNMWSGEKTGVFKNNTFSPSIKQHGCGLYRIFPVLRTGGASISLQTGKNTYSFDEAFEIKATVAGGVSIGAYVQLLCDDGIIGVLPVQSDGTATYTCSGLFNGNHSFVARYSGTPAVGATTSAPLEIIIEGGASEDLTALRQVLNNLISEAEATVSLSIAGATKFPLQTAIHAGQIVNPNSKTAINAAIEVLTPAIANAKASITAMTSLGTTITEAEEFIVKVTDSPAKTSLSEAIDNALGIYFGDSSTVEEVNVANNTLKILLEQTKLVAQPLKGECFEVTERILNPSFETNNTTGWVFSNEASGWKDARTWSDRPSAHGSYFLSVACENITWLDFYQEIKDLPSGVYSVEASMRNTESTERLIDQRVYAQVGEKLYESPYLTNVSGNNNNDWTLLSAGSIKLATGETLRIGCKSSGTGTGSTGWFQADDFRLYYWGSGSTNTPYVKMDDSSIQIKNLRDGIFVRSDRKSSLLIYTINGSLFSKESISPGNNYICLPQGKYLVNGLVVVIVK